MQPGIRYFAADTDRDTDGEEAASGTSSPLVGDMLARPDLYVDVHYRGGANDGFAEAPFTTVREAIALAAPGTRIAVAEGSYFEQIAITTDRLILVGGWRHDGNGVWTRDDMPDAGLTQIGTAAGSPAAELNGANRVRIEGVSLIGGIEATGCDDLMFAGNIAIGPEPIRIAGCAGVLLDRNQVVGADDAPETTVGIIVSDSSATIRDNLIHATREGIRFNGSGFVSENRIYIRNLDAAGMGLVLESGLAGDVRIDFNTFYLEGPGHTAIHESGSNANPVSLTGNGFHGPPGMILYHDDVFGDITGIVALNDGSLGIPEYGGNEGNEIASGTPCYQTQGTPCMDVVFIPAQPAMDGDNDGMADLWEIYHFDDLSRDGSGDFDNDGLGDLDEFTNGTNPTSPDSDEDGMSDLDELGAGRDPRIGDKGPYVYVDASFTGAMMTGAPDAPYNTVSAAVANASEGDAIALAKGTYVEPIVIDRIHRLRIEGGWTNNAGDWTRDDLVDPSLTKIQGNDTAPAVRIVDSERVCIDGIGMQHGFQASGAEGLTLINNIAIGPVAVQIENSGFATIMWNQIIGAADTPGEGFGIILINSGAMIDHNMILSDAVAVRFENSEGVLTRNRIYVPKSADNSPVAVHLESLASNGVEIIENVIFLEGDGIIGILEADDAATPTALADNHYHIIGNDAVLYHDHTNGPIADTDDLDEANTGIGTVKGNKLSVTVSDSQCPSPDNIPCMKVIYIPAPPGPDMDGDLMPDDWERYFFPDIESHDGTQDSDSDGLTDLEEYLNRTDPTEPDSDLDGVSDGDEVQNGTSPIIGSVSGTPDIYVDANAAGQGNGTPSSPYGTIGQAVRNARPGDLIGVAPGEYNAEVVITNIEGLRLEAGWIYENGSWRNGDSHSTMLKRTGGGTAIRLNNAPKTVIQGFYMNKGIYARNSDEIQLLGNTIIGDPGIHLQNCAEAVMLGNVVSAGSGIRTRSKKAAGNRAKAVFAADSTVRMFGNIIRSDWTGIRFDNESGGTVSGNRILMFGPMNDQNNDTQNNIFGITLPETQGADIQISDNVFVLAGDGIAGIRQRNRNVLPAELSGNFFFHDQRPLWYSDVDGTAVFGCERLNDGTLGLAVQSGNVCRPSLLYAPCIVGQDRACGVASDMVMPTDYDMDGDGIPDGWEVFFLGSDIFGGEEDPDNDGLTNIEEYESGTDPANADTDGDGTADGDETAPLDPNSGGSVKRYRSGIFKTGSTGEIKIDWLCDGGGFDGELGIFSLSGMESLIPYSTEFNREAARRTISGSVMGHVVFSGKKVASRFKGVLKKQKRSGAAEYEGTKRFEMEPGSEFAVIAVQTGTIESVYANSDSADPSTMPLFSVTGPDFPVHMAALEAGVSAFAFEFRSASGGDFDDLMISVFGALAEIQTLDDLVGANWTDWRAESETGRQIMEHVRTPRPGPETMWVSFFVDNATGLAVSDPDGRTCGAAGGYIPGAEYEIHDDGSRTVSLATLEAESYAIDVAGPENADCRLTVTGYLGDTEITSETADIVFDEDGSAEFDAVAAPAGSGLDITVEKSQKDEDVIIIATAGENGGIDPSGEVKLDEDESVTFTITSDPCHDIHDVKVDDVSVGAVPEYEFSNVASDRKIEAEFQRSAVMGDVDGDGTVKLADAVLALRIIAGEDIDMEKVRIEICARLDGKSGLGIEEAVYILQKVSEIR